MSPARTVKTPVIIETARYQIVGNVSVPADIRLSDYASDPDRTFFAVTEVLISPLDHPERERASDFVLVARGQVSIMRPGYTEQRSTTDGRWVFEEAFEGDPIVASAGTPPVLAY